MLSVLRAKNKKVKISVIIAEYSVIIAEYFVILA